MEETVDTGLPGDGSGPTYNKTHQQKLSIQLHVSHIQYFQNSNLADKAGRDKTKAFKVIIYPSAVMRFLLFYYPGLGTLSELQLIHAYKNALG